MTTTMTSDERPKAGDQAAAKFERGGLIELQSQDVRAQRRAKRREMKLAEAASSQSTVDESFVARRKRLRRAERQRQADENQDTSPQIEAATGIGTPFGDISDPECAFDGLRNTTAWKADSASCFVGRTFTPTTAVVNAKVRILSPASGDTGTITISLYGKRGAKPETPEDGIFLGQKNYRIDENSDNVEHTVVSSNDSDTWDAVWIYIQYSGPPTMIEVGSITIERIEPAPDAPDIIPGTTDIPPAVSPSGVRTAIEPRPGLGERARRIWALAGLCIGVPTLTALLYFGLFASYQWVSEARFAVRGADSGNADVLGGILSGIAGGSSSLGSDSYILIDYLGSRELVEKIDKEVNLRELYGASSIDYFSRFKTTLPIEYLVDYWRKRMYAFYDSSTSIITVQISGFSPENANRIALVVRREAEDLVNRLSDKAVEDALKSAKGEVTRSENRIEMVRSLMRRFRDKEQLTDPVSVAASKQSMLAGLEQQLSQINATMNSRRAFVNENSPTMNTLRARAEALEKEIVKARADLGGDDLNSTMSNTLASYEVLELQRQFAEKALTSSLAAVESARVGAERLRRYLAVYVEPKVAEYAMYPKVIQNTILTFLVSSILFALIMMLYASIREHIL